MRYHTVRQRYNRPELGEYITYGIRLENGVTVDDISTNRATVEALAEQCNRLQLSPTHLFELIEDIL